MEAVQDWPTQSSLKELENLLANQKTLNKQLDNITQKNVNETFFSGNKIR